MHRFFLEHLPEADTDELLLSPEESHHCLQVKRLSSSEEIILFDGKGRFCFAHFITVRKKQAVFQRIGPILQQSPAPQEFHLAVAPPKGDYWTLLLQKSTELGVHRITPLICQRSIVQPQERKSRWNQIVLEACKQCGRADLPQLEEPVSFENFLKQQCSELLLLASAQKAPLLRSYLPPLQKSASICLMIGPEGGFTEQEMESAKAKQALLFHEPGSILRVETAGIAFLAILRHLLQAENEGL
ncbi:MAG: RsmE family RNA methyltransferase [Planctomycetota bacterium]